MELTKFCPRCKETKALSEYRKHSITKTGQIRCQPYCKQCNIEYNKIHYLNNKQNYLTNNQSRKRQRRKEIYEFLREHCKNGCVECGESDFRCLDFDHLDRTTKESSISSMVGSGLSLARIEKELAKCRIVCANCHRKHTANQFNWYAD